MQLEKKKQACKNFTLFVSFFAVIVPVIFLVSCNSLLARLLHYDHLIIGIVVLVILVFTPAIAVLFYDNSPQHEKIVDYSLYISGFATLALVGYLVYYTGGTSHSFFSFFFFFLPSAVAISFEARRGLAIVCIASCMAFGINKYLELSEHPYPLDNFKTDHYTYMLIAFGAIHLLCIYLMEIKSRNVKKATDETIQA